jgi:pimeloyl-ACP methyl ester carboxylesterase
MATPSHPARRYIDTAYQFIDVGGTRFAHHEVGPRGDVPLVLFNHRAAVLDNFDPAIVDGLAGQHHIIALDYRGIGGSGGSALVMIDEMARDSIAVIQAMGFASVDLMGFSLGGMVAQDVALKAPDVVRKMILAGTGPAGGEEIARVGAVSWPMMAKGLPTLRDPKTYLFLTYGPNGRGAAKAFLARRKTRKTGRDKGPTPRALLRQLAAIKTWGLQAPQDLGRIRIPVLVANGDNDIMVPTPKSHDMARRIPGAELVIYPDAGHGGIVQNHAAFEP